MRHLIAFIALLIIQVGCTKDNNSFIGEWSGTNLVGHKITMIFDSDGYATFIVDNKVMGGKSSLIDGKTVSVKYSFDMKKEPIWLDVFTIHEGKETIRDKAIVKFIGKNKMQFKTYPDAEERPTDFDGKDTVLFTRVN